MNAFNGGPAAAQKRWYEKNRERVRQKRAVWKAANPDYHRNRLKDPEIRAKEFARSVKWKRDQQEKLAGRRRPENCELCGRTGRIVWDHDHSTEKFRGWLCYPCNTTLGVVGDDPVLLRKMAEYIEKGGIEL